MVLLVLKFISSLVRSARSLFRALFTIHVDLVKKSVKNMFILMMLAKSFLTLSVDPVLHNSVQDVRNLVASSQCCICSGN